MLTRQQVKSTIGLALCGSATTASDMAGQRHRCSAGSRDTPAGCIQGAVAGTECAAYRQADVVLQLLEKNRPLSDAIHRGYGLATAPV